ncbi:MAG: hypothetical protein ABEI78_00200 [Candidatus Nanohaloarchaea archaeon]
MAKEKTVSYRVDSELWEFLEEWDYSKTELSRENAQATLNDEKHEDYLLKRLNGEVDSLEEYASNYLGADLEEETVNDEFVDAVDRVLSYRLTGGDEEEIQEFISEYKEENQREGFLLETLYGLTDD